MLNKSLVYSAALQHSALPAHASTTRSYRLPTPGMSLDHLRALPALYVGLTVPHLLLPTDRRPPPGSRAGNRKQHTRLQAKPGMQRRMRCRTPARDDNPKRRGRAGCMPHTSASALGGSGGKRCSAPGTPLPDSPAPQRRRWPGTLQLGGSNIGMVETLSACCIAGRLCVMPLAPHNAGLHMPSKRCIPVMQQLSRDSPSGNF